MALASIDEDEFQMRLGRGRRVVVDFHADWCRPCHALAPELEKLAARFGEAVEFVKIDVDSNAGLALSLGIMTIPTVVLFSEAGEEISRSVGVARAEDLVTLLGLST